MLQSLISPIAGVATAFLKNRAEQAAAKQKLKVAKIEAQVKRVEQDGSWEEKAMDASADSWKDEAWMICFILIIVASFVPAAQPYMEQGFDFLRTAPEWIQWGILASIGASFGLKSIGKLKG